MSETTKTPGSKPEAKKLPRPLPKVNAYMDTRPFWDAAKDGKLVIQYCKDTGQPQFYPRPENSNFRRCSPRTHRAGSTSRSKPTTA